MTGEDNTLMMQNPVIPTFEGEEAAEISTNAQYQNIYGHVGNLDDHRSWQIAQDMMKSLHNGGASDLFQSQGSQIFETNQSFDMLDKRSSTQNMTRCVKVPSSEHVAEIVGRQGSKIKALRAKSNTYIKTPMRGEDPIFVVTGRQEDVAKAAQDIMSAAEHFTQIRACRKNQPNGAFAPGPPSNTPGSVTKQVTVPYRVVGLVVGPKGATIKRIQQNTQTYIVTPSREKDPIFEVTGMPQNVLAAEQEIMNHITHRTGNQEEYTAFLSMLAVNGYSFDSMSPAQLSNLFQSWTQSTGNNSIQSSVVPSFPPKPTTNSYNGVSQTSFGSAQSAVTAAALLSESRNGLPSSLHSSQNSGMGMNFLSSSSAMHSALSSVQSGVGASSQNLFGNATKNAFNAAVSTQSALSSSLMNGSSGPFSQTSSLQQAFASTGNSSMGSSNLLSSLCSSNRSQFPDLKSDLSTAQTVASVLSNLPVGPSTYSSASMADKFKSSLMGNLSSNLNYLSNNDSCVDYNMLNMPTSTNDLFDMSYLRNDKKNVDEGIDSLGSSRAGSSTGSPSLDKASTSPIMSTYPMKRSPLSSSDGSLTSSGGSPPPSWSVGSNLLDMKPENLEALTLAIGNAKISQETIVSSSLDTSSIAVAAAEKVLSSQASPSNDSSRRSSAAEVAAV